MNVEVSSESDGGPRCVVEGYETTCYLVSNLDEEDEDDDDKQVVQNSNSSYDAECHFECVSGVENIGQHTATF